MAINPLIALQGQAPDIGAVGNRLLQNVANLQQIQQQQDLAPLRKDILTEQLSALTTAREQSEANRPALELSQRDKQRLESITSAARQLKPLLDAGDTEGAKLFAQKRMAELQSAGLDQDETAPFLRSLEEGDLEKARTMVDSTLRLSGVLEQITPEKQAALDIRAQQVKLREQDQELKKLQIAEQKETNKLRREELSQKISDKRSEIEKGKRETQFQAESAISNVDNIIGTIDRALTGKGLEKASGAESILPTAPGSEAANFEAMLETLKSQAFLAEVEKMKGLGALSENEGRKLAAAVGSLDLSMSDKLLRSEIERIRTTFNEAKQRLNKKFDLNKKTEQGTQQNKTQPKTINFMDLP